MNDKKSRSLSFRRHLAITILVITGLLLVPVLVILVTTNFNITDASVVSHARDDSVQLLAAGFVGAALTAAIAFLLSEVQSRQRVLQEHLAEERQRADKELERERESNLRLRQEDQRNYEYRLRFVSKVTQGYNQMKAVRRTLIAYGFEGSVSISSDEQLRVYNDQMVLLNKAQLGFEARKREARVRSAAFLREGWGRSVEDVDKVITQNLEGIEKYLNRIIDEWERQTASTEKPRALKAFLGNPNLEGGIRAGWSELGHDDGPSVHLRDLEHLVALTDPRLEAVPGEVREQDFVISEAAS